LLGKLHNLLTQNLSFVIYVKRLLMHTTP